MIIGQIQEQAIGIGDKRMRQEILMRTEELETMVGRRMATDEIHQKKKEGTAGQGDLVGSWAIED